MKIIIFFLFFFQQLIFLNAQTNSDSLQPKKNKWGIGVLVGATYTNSFIVGNSPGANYWTYHYSPTPNLGINFMRMFNKNSIVAGAIYNEFEFEMANNYHQSSTYIFKQVVFPILYEREIGKHELKCEVGAGALVSRFYFASLSQVGYYNSNAPSTFKNFETFMLSGTVNAGIKLYFPISTHLLIRGGYVKNFIGEPNTYGTTGSYKPDYFTINLGVFYDF